MSRDSSLEGDNRMQRMNDDGCGNCDDRIFGSVCELSCCAYPVMMFPSLPIPSFPKEGLGLTPRKGVDSTFGFEILFLS